MLVIHRHHSLPACNFHTLPELRAIAKAKGMKKISTLKKGELIDLLVQSEEEIEAEENQKVQKQEIKKQDIKPIANISQRSFIIHYFFKNRKGYFHN